MPVRLSYSAVVWKYVSAYGLNYMPLLESYYCTGYIPLLVTTWNYWWHTTVWCWFALMLPSWHLQFYSTASWKCVRAYVPLILIIFPAVATCVPMVSHCMHTLWSTVCYTDRCFYHMMVCTQYMPAFVWQLTCTLLNHFGAHALITHLLNNLLEFNYLADGIPVNVVIWLLHYRILNARQPLC